MGKIKFPPDTETPTNTLHECFLFGEPLTVEFGDSGYFSGDNPDAFTPNPPTGNFVAPVTIGPYNAVAQPGEVTFTFFDTVNGKTYYNKITIAEICP